jgi:hypothetical protein
VSSGTSTRIEVLLRSGDVVIVSPMRIVVREVDTGEVNCGMETLKNLAFFQSFTACCQIQAWT